MTASTLHRTLAACFALLATASSYAADPVLPAPASAPRAVLLRAVHLFDSVSGHMIDNAEFLVVGNKIARIGSAGRIDAPAGAERIDLGDATLLPGFIDAHVH